MPTDHRAKLATIKRFNQLIAYLRDEMGWPIDNGSDFEDLTFEYTPEELGIDAENAAKIQEIKRLRPLSPQQPWGIFFVKFEPKRLPVVALRRILGRVALKKRASANASERQAWAADDLLFVSNYGEGDARQISFAHFSRAQDGHDLPTLKVLGWDNLDTALHLDAVARELTEHLAWPDDEDDDAAWRERWRTAFTLRHREVITTSKALSERLAELARAIRDRIQAALAIETDKGPLTKLMKAFQAALVHDLDANGFADMYAQTIAYGLLSARITDPQRRTADDFAAHMRTNPFLRELMETFLNVGGRRGKAGGPGIDFDELGVSEVVELLDDPNTKMEAVVRDFGDRNPQEDPVIHFYEHFLAAYDKKQKVSRGVFYTPRPVVSYIVRSVDELLRTEFGLADGLADTTTWGEMAERHADLKIPEGVSPDQDFVQILDPATGTGTFLVEVIDLIRKTMVEKWKAAGHGGKKIDSLWNEYVPMHLLPRLHGYELLMAPYAIAHLKIGLKLYETGYRFESEERARVYLTNALEPAQDFSGRFEFAIPALAHEAAAVTEIKRHKRFTVVIGNPPYSGESANKIQSVERDVKETYQSIDGIPLKEKGKKNWLLDDYVKFLRLSHRTIAATGCGFVGHIINNAFQDNPTFRGLRRSLLCDFSAAQILDLHGSGTRSDAKEEAKDDENVFDILQGVCVLVLSRPIARQGDVAVTRGDLWGHREKKYKLLLEATPASLIRERIHPKPDQWYFISLDLTHEAEWSNCESLLDAMPINGNGLISAKDHFAYAFTAADFERDLEIFLDAKLSDAQVAEQLGIRDNSMWSLHEGRLRLRRERTSSKFCRVAYRPFDIRHSLFHRDIIFNLRLPVTQHIIGGKNLVLLVTRMTKGDEWRHCFVSRSVSDCALLSNRTSTNAFAFPLKQKASAEGLFATHDGYEANFSPQFLARFSKALGFSFTAKRNNELLTPEDIFHYAYAVFHSPGYRSRYAEFLKIDFPRLPLPGNLELFRALARIGGALVPLHLLESPVLAKPITTYTGPRNPEVGRVGWSDDTVWLDAGKTNAREGHRATKPGAIGFHGVPEEVWDFHIGGYQVCHKWLKDRKVRTLSDEDIAHYQKIVVALSETIRLMQEIDEVIEQHGGWPGAFQSSVPAGAPAEVIPFHPPTVEPTPEERYVTCVPLVPLKAAAGAFGDPQNIENDDFEWVAVESRHRLRPGMFVAQVVGKSMEPAIPDGAWCLFRAPVEGTRQGKTVLVQLRDAIDPETGQRYTVKRYESEKAAKGDSWRHTRITLKPVSPDFEPIVLTDMDEGELEVIAEFVDVLCVNDSTPSGGARRKGAKS